MRKRPPSSSSFENSQMPAPLAVTRSKRAKTTCVASTHISKRARTEIVNAQLSCVQCKKKQTTSNLIDCKGKCSSKIHISCIQSMYGDHAKNAAQSWQCDNCESCRICKKGVVEGTPFLKCCVCFSCFHSTCHGTTVDGKEEENRFRCGACEKTRRKSTTTKGIVSSDRVLRGKSITSQKNEHMPEAVTQDDTVSSEIEDFFGFDPLALVKPPTLISRSKSVEHLASHPSQTEQCLPNDNRNPINDDIPDASEWSTTEVYEYFKGLFPRHAYVFAEQEIDGPALYYLRREDILLTFKLNVGPSLRIYQHILKLQTALQQKQKCLPLLTPSTFRKL